MHYTLKEMGAVDEENEIRVTGISFQLLGYVNDKGVVRLKEMASCSAKSFSFRRFPDKFSGAEFLAKVMKYYNAKLETILYFIQKNGFD